MYPYLSREVSMTVWHRHMTFLLVCLRVLHGSTQRCSAEYIISVYILSLLMRTVHTVRPHPGCDPGCFSPLLTNIISTHLTFPTTRGPHSSAQTARDSVPLARKIENGECWHAVTWPAFPRRVAIPVMSELPPIRRIVTTHDQTGVATVQSDGSFESEVNMVALAASDVHDDKLPSSLWERSLV